MVKLYTSGAPAISSGSSGVVHLAVAYHSSATRRTTSRDARPSAMARATASSRPTACAAASAWSSLANASGSRAAVDASFPTWVIVISRRGCRLRGGLESRGGLCGGDGLRYAPAQQFDRRGGRCDDVELLAV